ncbi:hypothetical protein [Pseudalkalibacillus hwajinpoensis]|uniref:Spore coat protein n=1 Tax=Guptibacillus hwajinpoensis TaxID=208199 RepID=A0A4U1MP22_9BACL|nr:hypothetical protein [Pseudalkalibacillus hwajinpoensis]TKD72465.1 hypothetical protein FBF83_06715 [Pseudalkalibacillus hwajinpoensis]
MTNFNGEHMANMKGKQCQVNLKGPEAKSGLLLNAEEDHLMLQTEDEIVYYNLNHVKSVSIDTTETSETTEEMFLNPINEKSFGEVAKAMQHKWVTINRGGPEHMEGVLASAEGDHLVLLKDRELVRVSFFHIKSLSTIQTKIKVVPEKEELNRA